MSSLVESPLHVTVTVHVDPLDVIRGLENNDALILNFVCQLIAAARSSDLRAQLVERLGASIVDETIWDDDEFIGQITEES